MAWFRYHTDALNDPKVQDLKPEVFKFWINLLCLARDQGNGGVLPSAPDIAFRLRLNPNSVRGKMMVLSRVGLLDSADAKRFPGRHIPHNWAGRQYESDDSKLRVQQFRERARNSYGNGDVTVTVTAPEAETEQKQKQKQKERKQRRSPNPPARKRASAKDGGDPSDEESPFAKYGRTETSDSEAQRGGA